MSSILIEMPVPCPHCLLDDHLFFLLAPVQNYTRNPRFPVSSHNHNPSGKNQHKPIHKSLLCYAHPDCTESLLASADDPILAEDLIRYHREGIRVMRTSSGDCSQRQLGAFALSWNFVVIKFKFYIANLLSSADGMILGYWDPAPNYLASQLKKKGQGSRYYQKSHHLQPRRPHDPRLHLWHNAYP